MASTAAKLGVRQAAKLEVSMLVGAEAHALRRRGLGDKQVEDEAGTLNKY